MVEWALPQTRGSTTTPSVVKLAAPLGGRVDVLCDGARARAQRCFARCAWHGRRSECCARRMIAKELAP